jgi:hypothetical protein
MANPKTSLGIEVQLSLSAWARDRKESVEGAFGWEIVHWGSQYTFYVT